MKTAGGKENRDLLELKKKCLPFKKFVVFTNIVTNQRFCAFKSYLLYQGYVCKNRKTYSIFGNILPTGSENIV